MKPYTPRPIDTTGITLREEILAIRERLAQNVHDLWAQQRTAEGWVYGPRRDEALRQTPCLVPYEDLPESEKEYDRLTATETLKTICALGYDIVKK